MSAGPMEGGADWGSEPFFDAPEGLLSCQKDGSAEKTRYPANSSGLDEPLREVTDSSPSNQSCTSFVDQDGKAAGEVVSASESNISAVSCLVSERKSGASAAARRRTGKIGSNLNEEEKPQERPGSPRRRSASGRIGCKISRHDENSALSYAGKGQVGNLGTVESPWPSGDISPTSFLVLLAGVVIKVIVFQISLLINFITFPIWLFQCYTMLIFHPFHTLKRVKNHFFEKLSRLCGYVFSKACPLLYDRFKSRQSIGKYAVQFGWGCFWSFYVCLVLTGIFGMAFVTSGFIMKWFIQEPVRMNEPLSFDYTKPSPVAFVPVLSCDGIFDSLGPKEKVDAGMWAGSRVIPANHVVKIEVSLTLPESDYNRRLGIFQVRVEFVSIDGKIIASSRHPCMLRYKSSPIRYAETFIKTGPLVAGYLSESQTLNLRMTRFTEGVEPTACVRILLEQRAEFRPGAGIPEIYAASLMLESQLPLFKKIAWKWKNTIFVWVAMWVFMMELVFMLVCCRPVLIQTTKQRHCVADRR